jgi:hypothetical protein
MTAGFARLLQIKNDRVLLSKQFPLRIGARVAVRAFARVSEHTAVPETAATAVRTIIARGRNYAPKSLVWHATRLQKCPHAPQLWQRLRSGGAGHRGDREGPDRRLERRRSACRQAVSIPVQPRPLLRVERIGASASGLSSSRRLLDRVRRRLQRTLRDVPTHRFPTHALAVPFPG